MGITGVTDTHRRAALRGREGVARWRLEGAVWVGRGYTLLFAALSIFPLVRRNHPDWISAGILIATAALMLVATQFVRRGSRVAACALLGAFLIAKVAGTLITGQPIWSGLLVTAIVVGALGNGVWGAFELAAVQREAATIPPTTRHQTS